MSSEIKVWEETWTLDAEANERTYNGARVLTPDGDVQFGEERGPGGETWFEVTEEQAARARLVAAAPDMARVLLAVEWIPDESGIPTCPVCEGMNSDGPWAHGHEKDCALDASLKKAGIVRETDGE